MNLFRCFNALEMLNDSQFSSTSPAAVARVQMWAESRCWQAGFSQPVNWLAGRCAHSHLNPDVDTLNPHVNILVWNSLCLWVQALVVGQHLNIVVVLNPLRSEGVLIQIQNLRRSGRLFWKFSKRRRFKGPRSKTCRSASSGLELDPLI